METPIADPVPVRRDLGSLRSQLTSVRSDDFSSVAESSAIAPFPKFVFRLIAILLTVTSVAKLWMLLTDSFTNAIVFASFGIFAAIRWSLGYTSCGCSGNLELPPWVFILIDVGILIGLLSFNAFRYAIPAGYRGLKLRYLQIPKHRKGQLAGFMAAVAIFVSLELEILSPLRARLLGDSPILATALISENMTVGMPSFSSVSIINRSNLPARVVGFSKSCSCVEFKAEPILIPANSTWNTEITIVPKIVGNFHQRVVFFLDHPDQFRLKIDVLGNVLKGKL